MITWFFRSCALLALITSPIFGSEITDWLNVYNPLLKQHVYMGEKKGIEGTLVDYNGLRNDPNFRKALYDLARLPSFDTLPRNDQLAMWINAYNILALNVIVENPKVKSIKDLDSAFNSIWTKKVGVVAGRQYALDEIEKEIILAKFQEPRAHFAINCASLSCPNLANYGYEGKYLDEQLDLQAKAFLGNPTKGMSVGSSKIILSKIFSWYAGDFTPSVKQWLVKNQFITAAQASYGISYMSYDWTLNSTTDQKP